MPGHSGLFRRGVGIDAIIIEFSKTFNLVPHEQLLTKLVPIGMDSRVVIWVTEFLVGHTQKVRVDGKNIQGSQSILRCVTRECVGPTTVSSVGK